MFFLLEEEINVVAVGVMRATKDYQAGQRLEGKELDSKSSEI